MCSLGDCLIFFESEAGALDIEADSFASLAARALASAHFGQSLAIWWEARQKRQRFLLRWHCLSCWVSLPSLLSFEERSGLDFFGSEELPLFCDEPEDWLEFFCLDCKEPLPLLDLELSEDLLSFLEPEDPVAAASRDFSVFFSK